MSKYIIKPTIAEEALESWIWTNDESLTSLGFIVIRNPKNRRAIKTFKRTLDENFEKIYNDKHTFKIDINNGNKYLVLNEYYRNILDIKKHQEIELKIDKADFLETLFINQWAHPNPTVQFANRMTILSIIIGLTALALTIYSICVTFQ